MAQILNCEIPESVLLNGAICKRFWKVSRRWRCAACHLLQVFTLSLSRSAGRVGENPGNEVEYADDTTFILDGSQSSFSRSLYLLDTFALISGLKVNYKEAKALWIGSCKSSEITLPFLILILWAKDKVYALGVWFSRSLSPFISLSFVGLPPTFSFSLSFSCSINIPNLWTRQLI